MTFPGIMNETKYPMRGSERQRERESAENISVYLILTRVKRSQNIIAKTDTTTDTACMFNVMSLCVPTNKTGKCN